MVIRVGDLNIILREVEFLGSSGDACMGLPRLILIWTEQLQH
jgi:hypothetical protein